MAIGIMQGRLLPPADGRIQCFPRERWQEEFLRARQAGLACIEWIYDAYGESANPIGTDAGIAQMRELAKHHGVQVRSLCADWFMDRPLLRVPAAERHAREKALHWLLGRCTAVGIQRVVLPFVDASRIESEAEMDEVVAVLERALPAARSAGVEMHLETSLAPADFARLLARLPAPQVMVNYDSGNSASLGYALGEEFAAYGERVGSVHIKDRMLGGSTVPLGTGATDFDALFSELRRIGYRGDFILQVARGEEGGEVQWAAANRAFVEARHPGGSRAH